MSKLVISSYTVTLRVVLGVLLLVAIIAAAGIITISDTKKMVYEAVTGIGQQDDSPTAVNTPSPFPVSVDPKQKTISDNTAVIQYLTTSLAEDDSTPIRTSWWHNLTRKLVHMPWYQNLASPTSRILVIWPGDRKEQVTDNFGDILRWDTAQREQFEAQITNNDKDLSEGIFMPGHYVVGIEATPHDVAAMVNERFTEIVLVRYSDSVAAAVPLQDALTIASLLEREAYSFEDMREISGVIWNRLFIDMPLQLDATLQYVKGNDPYSASWWPVPRPSDKFLDSPYNTYQVTGLPPTPIANPSPAAILAALNPNQTDCLFYFHHDDGDLHCSKDYDGHVEKLKSFYGRGQ